MTLKLVAICAAALIAVTVASHLAQAGGSKGNKGGVSAIAPGQKAPVPGDAGHSGNAPGDLKKDKGEPAKTFAPGQKNPK